MITGHISNRGTLRCVYAIPVAVPILYWLLFVNSGASFSFCLINFLLLAFEHFLYGFYSLGLKIKVGHNDCPVLFWYYFVKFSRRKEL